MVSPAKRCQKFASAGVYDHRRSDWRVLAGPSEASWRGVYGRVECLMAVETTLILLVRASCPFSPNPSPVDVLTAEITCLVFRKQWRFRRYRRIRTYLTYPPATRMLVDTDLKSMQRRLETELRELRESRDALPVQAVSIALAMKTASA